MKERKFKECRVYCRTKENEKESKIRGERYTVWDTNRKSKNKKESKKEGRVREQELEQT